MTDTSGWKRTAGGKITCPHCGKTGWRYGQNKSWIDAHAEHAVCPVCQKCVTRRGLNSHSRVHRRKGGSFDVGPCPDCNGTGYVQGYTKENTDDD